MIQRQLGSTGIQISPLIFGGNVFGWTIDEKTSFTLLDKFKDSGFNCVDTADVYSAWAPENKGGESETILGRWLKQKGGREKVIIATKVGSDMGEGRKGLSKKYILQAVEDSLKRLQTDYIDLYQSHFDFDDAPLNERLEAYTQLIKQGKVRAIGASNYNEARLTEALRISEKQGLASYQTLQPLYNLYDREIEEDLQPLCVQHNIGIIPYYSLAAGFLTGKYKSEKDVEKNPARAGGVKKYLNEKGFRILKVLNEIAAELNVTPAQVSLAWLLTRPAVTAPIASSTNIEQLNDLVKGVQLKLDDAAIERLNKSGE
jgi:aryl-alcohol dehydrogenase-like predicted oxidoreductase